MVHIMEFIKWLFFMNWFRSILKSTNSDNNHWNSLALMQRYFVIMKNFKFWRTDHQKFLFHHLFFKHNLGLIWASCFNKMWSVNVISYWTANTSPVLYVTVQIGLSVVIFSWDVQYTDLNVSRCHFRMK